MEIKCILLVNLLLWLFKEKKQACRVSDPETETEQKNVNREKTDVYVSHLDKNWCSLPLYSS